MENLYLKNKTSEKETKEEAKALNYLLNVIHMLDPQWMLELHLEYRKTIYISEKIFRTMICKVYQHRGIIITDKY